MLSAQDAPSAVDIDEPTRLARHLAACAQTFLGVAHGGEERPPEVLPALKCLFMALSLVLPLQLEAELRLVVGNVLLDYTQNFDDALDQLQKAQQLALSVRRQI